MSRLSRRTFGAGAASAALVSQPVLAALPAPPLQGRSLVLNRAILPIHVTSVRRALSLMIDRKLFIDRLLDGAGEPAGQMVPQGLGGFDPSLTPTKADMATAKKLLAEAGYPFAKGFPQLKLSYSSNARNKARMEALADSIRKVLWIDIVLDPVESRAYTALLKKQETTPPMFVAGWCQDYPDPQNWYSLVFTSSSSIDHTAWKNKEYDKLCDAGDKELDNVKRTGYYKQAAQLLLSDAAVAFFYQIFPINFCHQ